MNKEKEWLKDKIKDEERDLKYVYDNYVPYEKVLIADDVYDLIDQLDEPEITLDKAFEKVAESYLMTKEEIWRHLERLETHGGKVTYDEPKVLSHEWIDENKVEIARIGNLRKMTRSDVVRVEKLKNLLVPKQDKPEVEEKFYTFDNAKKWLEDNGFVVFEKDKSDEEVQRMVDETYEAMNEKPIKAVKGYFKSVKKAKEVLEELGYVVSEKSTKPTIPQFVAEYIEKYKGRGFSLGAWFEFVNDEDEFENKTEEWLYNVDTQEEKLKREYLLIDAIRYGYEVEKEKKYLVMDRHDVYLLAREEERNKVETVAKLVEIYGSQYVELNYHLTEQEIKDYDERYIPFMVPVDEVNNE